MCGELHEQDEEKQKPKTTIKTMVIFDFTEKRNELLEKGRFIAAVRENLRDFWLSNLLRTASWTS